MSPNFNTPLYIYTATDKKTGEFIGYLRRDPAYSPLAFTTSVLNAEYTLNIKVAREVLHTLQFTDGDEYDWKIQEVVITTPKDVE